jgi:PAS domain S-box-containing protein
VPLRDAEGQIIGLVGISRDITERKRNEDQLNLLNTAMCAAPSGVTITDEHGVIKWVNPAFSEATGYSSEESVGRNSRFLQSGQHTEEFYADLWRTIASGQNWRGEIINRCKDGRLITEDVTIAPVRDETGAIRHFVAVKLDITAQRAADRRLRQQAELLDRATEAIVVAGLEGQVTFWNRGAEQLFGFTASEMLGKPLTEVLDLGTGGAEVRHAISAMQDWQGEVRGVDRQSRPKTIECRISTIRDHDNRPNARLCISSDVTERKNLEERFLRAQRLENIGMLAAGIAHDLNNVLAPIRMVAPLLRDFATTPGSGRLLDTLEKCVDRGAGLVHQILGFARGIGGEPREVQVKHLLRDVVEVISATFPKSITIEEAIPSDLWPVNVNPTQIHQVLLNLCVNARDAMPAGGTLRVRGENCVLDSAAARVIDGARPGAWLVLEIADTGTGIPPDLLAHIWEPFFTTKTAEKGTGLGLSTVRGIVATHQGFVTLTTELNRGTAFRVYLPAVERPLERAGDGGAQLPIPQGNGEMVLVVDDEEPIRECAKAMLTRHGYRVFTARDGVEGAEIFGAHAEEIALVITDLDMPRLDGAALAAIIRQRRPAIKILVVSGHPAGSRFSAVQAEELADMILAKPFSLEALLRAVDHLLHAVALRS